MRIVRLVLRALRESRRRASSIPSSAHVFHGALRFPRSFSTRTPRTLHATFRTYFIFLSTSTSTSNDRIYVVPRFICQLLLAFVKARSHQPTKKNKISNCSIQDTRYSHTTFIYFRFRFCSCRLSIWFGT